MFQNKTRTTTFKIYLLLLCSSIYLLEPSKKLFWPISDLELLILIFKLLYELSTDELFLILDVYIYYIYCIFLDNTYVI